MSTEENKTLTVNEEMEDVVFDIQPQETVLEEPKHSIQDFKCTFVDGLENDKNVVGCQYVLLSVLAPTGILNCDTWGIKVRGFENKEESAEKKAELMRKRDKFFDVFVGMNGSWHPLNPTTTQIEDEKFGNQKLGKIMKKVHETEKKEKTTKDVNAVGTEEALDNEYDIIKNLNQRKNEKESDVEGKSVEFKYLYDKEDCLDEDPIIPDKRYALISFLSPELAINCKEKCFKIRGYSRDYSKAYGLAKALEKSDETFNICVVEVGKWAPVNFKLIGKMKKYDEQKKALKQELELKNLNELVGRYKENLNNRKEILQKRKKEKILQSAQNNNDDDEDDDNTDVIENIDNLNTNSQIQHQDLGKGTGKERLLKMLEKSKKTKNAECEEDEKYENDKINSEDKKEKKTKYDDLDRDDEGKKVHDPRLRAMRLKKIIAERKAKQLEATGDKQIKIREEALRINEKKQNLEELKTDKLKLEENLQKMKNLLANKMNSKSK
jgi:hypothetical protein